MRRILIVLCMIFGVACSRVSDNDAVVSDLNSEVEEGGVVENADRDTAEAYLVALGKVGKHVLSCPYFPPVTPWTEHSFLDVKNLELLPQ